MSKSIKEVVNGVKTVFATGKTKTVEWRVQQLKALRNMIANEEKRWYEAMNKDLKQTEFLKLVEVRCCVADIDTALSSLSTWMKPEARNNNAIANLPGTAYIHKEPYAIQLLVRPLVGAIAAGNAAVIKPSEVSENVSRLFGELTPKYLDKEAIVCVEGSVKETTELLQQRWDYIFYTGSPAVGKIVMKAAAEYLTPVTLELGGKSPCIIDKTADLDAAARRVSWGKYLNSGQSCIAPDYILVHKDVKKQFEDKMMQYLKEHYASDIQKDQHFSRVITSRHTARVQQLLDSVDKKSIICGGKVDVQDKFVEPTLVDQPSWDSQLMKEEIFAPVLPIYPIESADDAIKIVNKGEKPLALYIFSTDSQFKDKIMKGTTSGGVTINDTMYHFLVPDLPFGGVGESGMGSYNGKTSFETFSHNRSVFDRSLLPGIVDTLINQRFPPYTDAKVGLLKLVVGKSLPTMDTLKWIVLMPIIAALVAFVYRSKL